MLTRISLESKDQKEKTEVMGLKKTVETCEFIVFIIIWERLLVAINRASLQLQVVHTDLSLALLLLSMAARDLQQLRDSWNSIKLTATALASVWGIPSNFNQRRQTKTRTRRSSASSH